MSDQPNNQPEQQAELTPTQSNTVLGGVNLQELLARTTQVTNPVSANTTATLNNTVSTTPGQPAITIASPIAAAEPASAQNSITQAPVSLPLTDDEEEYTGSGIIIEKVEEKIPPAPGELDAGRLAEIEKYQQQMDEEIALAQKLAAEHAEAEAVAQPDEEDEEDNEERAGKFLEAYNRAVVIIDKANVGKVEFTDEERKKLEVVKKIRLEEVETVELSSLRVRKKKTNNVDRLIRQQQTFYSTPVVLPASGYTARVTGLSSYELLTLINSTQNPKMDMQTRWSLIHDKIESTSIGKMNYDTFMKKTAVADYNVLIYGLLCATYPEVDTVTMTCSNDKCKHSNPENPYLHSYEARQLIRAEEMTDELRELIMKIVDNSYTVEKATEAHANAPVSVETRYRLPRSGIVITTSAQSAHDFVYKTIEEMSDDAESRLQQATVFATMIRTAYVPDGDEYEEFDSQLDISKIVYALADEDLIVLQKIAQEQGKLSFEFGFMDVKCPECGHYHEVVPVEDLEDMVFYRYRQNMSSEIE